MNLKNEILIIVIGIVLIIPLIIGTLISLLVRAIGINFYTIICLFMVAYWIILGLYYYTMD